MCDTEKNCVTDTILGFVLGDCFGMMIDGADFKYSDKERVYKPGEISVYNTAFGVWSSPSAMTLCTLESLLNGIDCDDIMKKLSEWYTYGYMTPSGQAIALDAVVLRAILNYKKGVRPVLKCAKSYEIDSPNGALGRILPIVFVVNDMQQCEKFEAIHTLCSLTHPSKRSMILCSLFVLFIINLLNNRDKDKRVIFANTLKEIYSYYMKIDDFKEHMSKCRKDFYSPSAMGKVDFLFDCDTDDDALRVALDCFLKGEDAYDSIVDSANFGGDAGITSALAGALAGAYYSEDNLPYRWLTKIEKLDEIRQMCQSFEGKYCKFSGKSDDTKQEV